MYYVCYLIQRSWQHVLKLMWLVFNLIYLGCVASKFQWNENAFTHSCLIMMDLRCKSQAKPSDWIIMSRACKPNLRIFWVINIIYSSFRNGFLATKKNTSAIFDSVIFFQRKSLNVNESHFYFLAFVICRNLPKSFNEDFIGGIQCDISTV